VTDAMSETPFSQSDFPSSLYKYSRANILTGITEQTAVKMTTIPVSPDEL
jgi:hypothetical protein